MSSSIAITLHPAGAETAAGQGAAVDLGLVAETVPRSAARLDVAVTALANIERVRVIIDHGPANVGPWLEVEAIDVQQTGDFEISVADTKRWLRVRWEFTGASGSPSVTFSVAGLAHQVYVGPRDLGRYGIRQEEIDAILTPAAKADACIAVSDEADGYLNGAYTLPIVAWDDGLKGHLARMAIRYGLDRCGWQPDGPGDKIETGFDRALMWLKLVQKGTVRPPGIVDSTPTKNKNSARVARVSSCVGRGWGEE